RFHGIEITTEKFKNAVVMPTLDDIADTPLERETMRKILLSDMPNQIKAVCAGCATSGCRLGEFLQLQYRDLHFDENPARIVIRGATTKGTKKGRKGREVFVTSEAKDFISA